MGAWLGKSPTTPASVNGSGGGSSSNGGSSSAGGSSYDGQFSSYEAACRLDPELQSFDATLQQRTSHAISTLPIAGDVGLRSLSFDSLREVTSCLLDVNQEVVKVILDCKKDIWKNAELFDLVEEYFNCSLQTLDFCTVLEKCLKKARDSQLVIQFALRQFDTEKEEMQVDGKKKYARTMDELQRFKAMGDPFTAEFFQVFRSVYERQLLMFEKLRRRKNKLDKKLKSVKAWRKISCIIFGATFAAVLICSIVAAAVAAPPVAAALAAAATIPVGSMGKWIDSLWKEHRNALEGQKEVLSSMKLHSHIVINDLKNIRALVDQLEVQFSSLLNNAEFALRDEEAVKFGIEEIRKKLEVFMNSVESLGAQADRCSGDVTKARTVVLQKIIKHPDDLRKS